MSGEEAKRRLIEYCQLKNIPGLRIDGDWLRALARLLDEQEKAQRDLELQLKVKEAQTTAAESFVTGLAYVGDLTEEAGREWSAQFSRLRRVEEAAQPCVICREPNTPAGRRCGWCTGCKLAAALGGKEPIYA